MIIQVGKTEKYIYHYLKLVNFIFLKLIIF